MMFFKQEGDGIADARARAGGSIDIRVAVKRKEDLQPRESKTITLPS